MAENNVSKGYVISVNEAESGVDEPVGASSSSDALTSSSDHGNSANNSPRKSPHEFLNGAIELEEFTLPNFDDKHLSYSTFPYNINQNPPTSFQSDVDNKQEIMNKIENDSNNQKQTKSSRMYSFFQPFRYADFWDMLLMISGIILALAQGAALPAALFVHAKILNIMIAEGSCWSQLKTQLASNDSVESSISLAHLPDHLTNGQTYLEAVGPLCGWYALIGAGIFLGGVLHTTAWTIAGERQIYHVRVKLFRAILSKDAGWFDQKSIGALTQILLEKMRKIEGGMTATVSVTCSWLGTAIAGVIFAFVSDWLVSLVACSLVPLMFVISFIMIRLIRKYSVKQSEAYRKADAVAKEVIGNWRTVLSFNKQEYETKRYGDKLETSQHMGILKNVASGASQGLIYLVIYTITGLSFWWGNGGRVGQEGGTVMQVILCIIIAALSLGIASLNFETFTSAFRASVEVFKIIDEKSKIDNFDDTGTWVETLRGDICLENVSFSYPDSLDRPVLQGISLFLPRGKTVALVGPSGGGKSTIIQLLLRYYDVTGGKLTVDDVDIRDLNVRWFRQQIGLVSQEPVLFNTTIRDNIRLGAVDQAVVSDDDIVTACRLANAHDFITRLPMGYDTMVGERGAQLSGGQKQRIAIARALVSNPRILVLDEATSALDSRSAAIVQEALDKARVGRTTLMIAHRLSTIRNADLIAVVDQGSIVELGTHDQLIEHEGLYYRMVENQQKAAEAGTETPINGSELDLTNELHYLVNENSNTVLSAGKTMNDSFASSILNTSSASKLPPPPKVLRLNSNISISSRGKGVKIEGARRPSIGLTGIERGDTTDGCDKCLHLNRFRLMATVLRWGRPELPLVIICGSLSILSGGIQPSFFVVFSEFVASFCPVGDGEKFKMLLGIVVMLGAVQVILLTMQHLLFAVIGERLTARTRCHVLAKILRMDAGWLGREENKPPILTNILANDCSAIQGISGVRIGFYLSAVVLLGASVIYSLILDYRVALALIGMMPFVIGAAFAYNHVSYGMAREGDSDSKENAVIAMDAISNMRTVMALAAEPYFLEQFSNRFYAIRNRTIKMGIAASPLFSFILAAIPWAGAVAFSLGSFLMDKGETEFWQIIRIYVLLTFCAVHFISGFVFGRSSSAIPEEDVARKSALIIKRIVEQQNTIDTEDPLTGESLAAKQMEDKSFETKRCAGRIEFKSVVFSYPTRPGAQVLSGLSFTIDPGQCVALCGPSGGGKSTVVQLLQRLYDPKSGIILVDGIDIRSTNLRWLRANVGLVSCEPALFTALSIFDNVAYGSRSDDRPILPEIENACKMANAMDFINSLPDRFNTIVGEGESQLGDGQKQRLAIARALVRNPSILLLDEATSALDAESEHIVQDAIDRAEEGRTSVVIAHRLSTIQHVDKIIVIENGRVVEEGTHLELMHQRGTYYRLQQFQNGNHLQDINNYDGSGSVFKTD